MDTQEKTLRRLRRKGRVRAKVSGTPERPRLAVYRSNTKISAQLIDDTSATTIAAVSTAQQKSTTQKERVVAAAQQMAQLAQDKKITKVVFDRGGYLYTGNIKMFADTVREAGIEF